MDIYLLEAKDNLDEDDNPWEPWYDKTFGFVVVADSEDEARKIADGEAGDENRGEFMNQKTSNSRNPWLDEKYSTCKILVAEKKGVVIEDHHSA